MFGTNRIRVRNWFNYLQIPLRPRAGAGTNHLIYNVTQDQLQHWIDQKKTNVQIAALISCGKSNVLRLMSKYGLKSYRPDSGPYQKYCRRVRHLTNKTYLDNEHVLNPLNLPRTLCGVPGGYQLDHIKGIRECFHDGWTVEQAAHLSNLQFISWESNLAKRVACGRPRG
jgi:hypothetical protein